MANSFKFTFDDDSGKIQVSSESTILMSQLIDVFTIPNPQYFYLQSRGYGFVDESLSVITTLGTFKSGLFPLVYKSALKIVGGDASRIEIDEIAKSKIIKACMPLKGKLPNDCEIDDICENLPLRDYQREAVHTLLKYGSGICLSPTSSGKSLIQATLINEIRKHKFLDEYDKPTILVLVPSRQLVDQMYKDFTTYGLSDFCMFTSNSGFKRDGTFMDNSCSDGFANVIITNHSWLKNQYKTERFKKLKIGCIIADEVHTVSYGTEAMKIVEKINPPLKFGFTGTLKDDLFKQWTTFGMFGVTVYNIDIKTLQCENFITPLEVQPIYGVIKDMIGKKKCPFSLNRTVKLNDVLEDGTIIDTNTAYSMELEYLESHANEIYSSVFKLISEEFDFKNKNMIVLFDRTNIGRIIESQLQTLLGDRCKILYTDGSTDISIREGIREKLEGGVGHILIAQTVTASTGLNIKNLHGIVFAFYGRSYVRVVQSIGRVLRLSKNKTVAKLYDLWYNTRYSTRYHDDKMKIFRTTYGEKSIKEAKRVEI